MKEPRNGLQGLILYQGYIKEPRANKEKKPHGGTGANQYSEQSRQNDDSAKTVEKIATD